MIVIKVDYYWRVFAALRFEAVGKRLLTLTDLSLYWWGSDLITATFIDWQYFSFSFPFLVAIVTPKSERVAKHYSINIGGVDEQTANYFR